MPMNRGFRKENDCDKDIYSRGRFGNCRKNQAAFRELGMLQVRLKRYLIGFIRENVQMPKGIWV